MNVKNRFLSFVIAGTALTANAFDASYYSSSSRLSEGRWVKIKVEENGIQQISFKQLRSWGFGDPSKVAVFGYGGQLLSNDELTTSQPDDLPRQHSIISNDRILFYGESGAGAVLETTQSPYYVAPYRGMASDEGYYFLTETDEPSPIQSIAHENNPNLTATDTHVCVQIFEEDSTSPVSAGRHLFGTSFHNMTAVDITFDIYDQANNSAQISSYWVGVPTNGGNGRLTLTCYSGDDNSMPSTGGSTNISLAFNNSNRDYLEFLGGESKFSRTLNPNSTKFKVRASRSISYNYLANDYIGLGYQRFNRMRDFAELPMTFTTINNKTPIKIYDATAETQIWDVSSPASCAPYESSFDAENSTALFSYKKAAGSTLNNRAIAFQPSSEHHEVYYAGEVANQSIHSAETPNLLIIASDVCYDQALRLADIHRSKLGHKVLVVKQDEIFNEFSSGTPSPIAYRRLAKMFYDRNPQTFHSLLLFGAGSFDNRGKLNPSDILKKEGVLLMTYPVGDFGPMANYTTSYTSDAYFGLLEDGFSGAIISTKTTPKLSTSQIAAHKMSISVGRIPAQTYTKAANAVDKIEHYLNHLPTADTANKAIIMTDSGNQDMHLLDGEAVDRSLSSESPNMTLVKAYDALFPWKNTLSKENIQMKSLIKSYLEQGVGFFSYSGHSSYLSLQSTANWLANYWLSINHEYFPIGMLSSCDTYPFDVLKRNQCEEIVYKPDGGLIGIIGACRTVFQDRNRTLSLNVAKAYSRSTASTMTGDIFRQGFNTTIETYKNYDQGRLNTLCYNFCGDPALPLYQAAQNIVIETINGEDVAASEPAGSGSNETVAKIQLKSMAANQITGYIKKADNQIDADFNGTVTISMYEAPKIMKTLAKLSGNKGNGGDSVGRQITVDYDMLMQTVAKVENGRFNAEIYPTAISREGDYNRITFYAYNADRTLAAKGATTAARVSLAENSLATPEDTDAPEIKEFYIDSPAFNDGDCVDGAFTLHATIAPDQSGLKVSSSQISTGSRITIDSDHHFPLYASIVKEGVDGETIIDIPVDNLTDGRHTASITAIDNLGNSSSREISFFVANRSYAAELGVEQMPARVEATISLSHNLPATPTGRLIIEDANGRLVKVFDNFGETATWDLFDNDGNPVADGVYTARAMVRAGMKFAATQPVDIIVLQKQ